MDAAYVDLGAGVFRASALTHGPWYADHQHAGPPSALICRAAERAAVKDGLTHLGRLTVNLFRPAPVGECSVEVTLEYVGRNAGHYAGRLIAQGKDIAHFTALMQREDDLPIPDGRPAILRPAPRSRQANARSSRCLSRTQRSATATWWRIGSQRDISLRDLAPTGFA